MLGLMVPILCLCQERAVHLVEASSFSTVDLVFKTQKIAEPKMQSQGPLVWREFIYNKNIKTQFCTKTDTTHDYGIIWPKGSYCIGKKGSCPGGFAHGWIRWDDEDKRNRNSFSGILPDGVYNKNTRVDFCCRNDGFPTNLIILPMDKPFYLYRLCRDGCQRVRGMHYHQD